MDRRSFFRRLVSGAGAAVAAAVAPASLVLPKRVPVKIEMIICGPATLTKMDWVQLDQLIMATARKRLTVWADVESKKNHEEAHG